MIDSQIIDQLKALFENLAGNIELAIDRCTHDKQAELEQMLEQVAATAQKISVVESGQTATVPGVHLRYQGRDCGVAFRGVPGGHEFSSLVLAILNADGKGKLPDQVIIDRIQRLQGPIALKTYVSLSCENCPEVVQALNLVALFHPDITHEMVDGAFFQEEIAALNIQGVPSVVQDRDDGRADGSTDTRELVSSGKADLTQLLSKLESRFGTPDKPSLPANPDLGAWDAAVVGGGPAGASAAIYLARKGLKTILIAETIGGQVKETQAIENLISVPLTQGARLAQDLYAHIQAYDIRVLEHRRMQALENQDPKRLQLDTGEHLTAKSVILATGAKWRTLDIPGEKAYTGRGVAFCPHCDGPFYKGKDVAVIGGGNSGIEAAIDLSGIVRSVTVFEFLPELKADKVLVETLEALPNVSVVKNAQTLEVEGDGAKVTGIVFKDRETGRTKHQPLDGIFVQIGLVPNSDCVSQVVSTNRFGEIIVDEKCKTSAPGIYASGDVTTVPYKQIIISMGEGAKAALTAFEDLVLKPA